MEADLYELKLCRFLCPLNCATKFSGVPSLSMGISEEIEDAKIVSEKTKISRLKRRSEN